MKILVTGFGPFGPVKDNASAHLAEGSGHSFKVLEVSYRAVEDYFDELAKNPPDVVLLLGHDLNAHKMRLETVAHNRIGEKEDVRGEVWGPGPIDPLAPAQLSATLWIPEVLFESETREPGCDAGGYLCNFSFFKACQKLPRTRVGFIHVPPFERIDKEVQLREIGRVLRAVAIDPVAF
jgi:pyrrolidone-carboxylate peptidase